ncbi:hypothetical protein K493DRAFT_302711 [Basidiobolus meristosporus CBS 931.73]|uniref:Uncharacterized protein n=1 Tax=Basidiobolus meristosporus CBS 931.73 TaxID=1314790 RepID=A0A1Y1Y5W3_9FUNG|nr:hypothetical protein K493DRAFT_302711 [Basidiobolus meristosporus CBS 931.73]|eukprot:ORX93420.1 hypothetical protein K493DRAFT_302711 [Basidiobolus meristosporus CBS 931.73]
MLVVNYTTSVICLRLLDLLLSGVISYVIILCAATTNSLTLAWIADQGLLSSVISAGAELVLSRHGRARQSRLAIFVVCIILLQIAANLAGFWTTQFVEELDDYGQLTEMSEVPFTRRDLRQQSMTVQSNDWLVPMNANIAKDMTEPKYGSRFLNATLTSVGIAKVLDLQWAEGGIPHSFCSKELSFCIRFQTEAAAYYNLTTNSTDYIELVEDPTAGRSPMYTTSGLILAGPKLYENMLQITEVADSSMDRTGVGRIGSWAKLTRMSFGRRDSKTAAQCAFTEVHHADPSFIKGRWKSKLIDFNLWTNLWSRAPSKMSTSTFGDPYRYAYVHRYDKAVAIYGVSSGAYGPRLSYRLLKCWGEGQVIFKANQDAQTKISDISGYSFDTQGIKQPSDTTYEIYEQHTETKKIRLSSEQDKLGHPTEEKSIQLEQLLAAAMNDDQAILSWLAAYREGTNVAVEVTSYYKMYRISKKYLYTVIALVVLLASIRLLLTKHQYRIFTAAPQNVIYMASTTSAMPQVGVPCVESRGTLNGHIDVVVYSKANKPLVLGVKTADNEKQQLNS